jgi:hypothetical protein
MHCPLCESRGRLFWEGKGRAYFRCDNCHLVFLDPASHPSPERERAEYDLHQNSPTDERYRRHLAHLMEPLLARLSPGMAGLDFGSGPGPTLSVMLREQGMKMSIYDPLYAPDTGVLQTTYDFVTCSEVVEHFRAPGRDWASLVGLVSRPGWLGVMTKQVPESPDEFAAWHYRRDPTHLCFYAPATWQWLAARHHLYIEYQMSDVTLLRNPK